MKRVLSFLLVVVFCSALLPWMPIETEAASVPENVSVAEAETKIYELYNILGDGSYFTVNQNACSTIRESGHGCSNCSLSSIIEQTWFKNKFGTLSTSQFPRTYYSDSNSWSPSGRSCFAFATFAEWYIYANAKTDKVTTECIGTFNYDYDGVSANIRVGDLIRLQDSKGSTSGHSAIVISYDKTGVKVLDSNWSGKNCEVHLHTIKYSSYNYFVISRATNSVIKEEGYLGKCTSYPSYCNVKTTKTTYIKSLPCSESTDANSKNVETASQGSQYKAIGLYKNTAGNLWYKVTAKNGSVGYLYAGDTSFVSFDTSDLTCPGVTVPTNHTVGKSYALTGKVSSTYNQLKEITVSVLDKNGTSVTEYTDTVNGNSYTLKSSTIDSKTKFGSLSVGTYTFVVKVKYRSYYAKSATVSVTYQQSVDIYKATFNVVSGTCTHSYSYKATKNPTTSATGTLTGTCSKCSGTKTVTLPKLTTSDYTYKVTKAATCTTTGTGRYTWNTTTYGTFYFDVSIAAKGHSYANATCTKPKTCSTCGTTSGSALGHSYNSGVVTKAATCTAEGVKTYTCTTCKATKTEKIAATGHSYANATCTKPKTCSTCGTTSGSALGHNYNSGVITEAATCTAEGVKTYTCTTCKATKTEKIAATGHSYANATCTKPKTCSTCGTTSGSALGHNYNSGVITEAATCKDAGTKTYTCTKCGDIRNETIAKLTTHTYDNSCDTGCNVCGQIRTVSHQYGYSWYTDENNHWHTCNLCGDIKDKVAHIPGAAATENTAQTCTVCDYIITAALGHTHKFSAEMTQDRDGHWYACEGCNEKKSYANHVWENACDTACDACGYTRKITHQCGQQWCKNDTAHWHECQECGTKDIEESHIPGMEATANTAQTCVVCNYEIAPALGVQETTQPATQPDVESTTNPSADSTVSAEDKEKEQEATGKNSILAFVLIVVVATAITSVVATVVIMKRKK